MLRRGTRRSRVQSVLRSQPRRVQPVRPSSALACCCCALARGSGWGRIVAVPAAEPTPAPIVAALPQRHVTNQPVRSRLRAARQGARDSHVHVDAELRLIAQADAELRAEHFDAALSTLALHARSFPKGALRDERAALRVLSLCGKQPGPEALRERERFLRTAPQSVLTARVNAACADSGARSP